MKRLLCKCIILSQLFEPEEKRRMRQNEQSLLIMTTVEKMNREYFFMVSPKIKGRKFPVPVSFLSKNVLKKTRAGKP